MKKTRILIIEDNRVLCDGIKAMINGEGDMRVVATIENENNILQKISQTKPQIILLDVGLGNVYELSIVELVKKKFPKVKVIAMGFIPTQADIIEVVKAGASGFILKTATVKDFINTLRSVAQGVDILPPSMTDSLFSYIVRHSLTKRKGGITNAVRMTKREREIIVLIAEGLSNKEISVRLNIASYTVKSHVHNILEKLALHSRLQIAMYTKNETES